MLSERRLRLVPLVAGSIVTAARVAPAQHTPMSTGALEFKVKQIINTVGLGDIPVKSPPAR
jgi:hypothetical protein